MSDLIRRPSTPSRQGNRTLQRSLSASPSCPSSAQQHGAAGTYSCAYPTAGAKVLIHRIAVRSGVPSPGDRCDRIPRADSPRWASRGAVTTGVVDAYCTHMITFRSRSRQRCFRRQLYPWGYAMQAQCQEAAQCGSGSLLIL